MDEVLRQGDVHPVPVPVAEPVEPPAPGVAVLHHRRVGVTNPVEVFPVLHVLDKTKWIFEWSAEVTRLEGADHAVHGVLVTGHLGQVEGEEGDVYVEGPFLPPGRTQDLCGRHLNPSGEIASDAKFCRLVDQVPRFLNMNLAGRVLLQLIR